ncbi:glucose 1-dehydrogenase [Nocardia sp. NPDC088792]|uniref:glucose 1-dehydrogenase n=1 Tax=Nocardia sp. NPDC088792 TaxID=3364332 RepID=UPI00380A82AC
MTQNNSRFLGRTALITGGTSGMGAATARRLLAEGARVIITGRDKTRLDAAVAEITGGTAELADRLLAVRADSADLTDLAALAETIRERCGRLDVLFANAGVGAFAPIGEVTAAEFDRIVGVNFRGVYFTIQQSLPLLTDGGSIVINASWTLHRGLPGASVYAATKAAVHNLSRTLAAELSARRIRVNSISPGYITTPMFHENVAPEAHSDIVGAIAAGRLGTVEDIAGSVAFLASDEASYINGQDLVIDGGIATSTPAAML